MENVKGETVRADEVISKVAEDNEMEKEQKAIRLIIEIIVSSTLKEFYEKGD